MLIRVLKHMVDAFHSRRDLVVGLLKEIPGVKSTFQKELTYSQTFSFFENIERNRNQKCNGFSMYLSEANVATVTGDALEIPSVSLTQPATILKEALKRIKDALAL
jgi:aspartate aminotransferase